MIARLKTEAAAQKKKAATLGILVLVLLIVVVRLFVGGSDAPQTVAAAPPTPTTGVKVTPPVVVQPTAGGSGGWGAGAKAHRQDDIAMNESTRNVDLASLPRTLARDPFEISGWYRKPTSDEEGAEHAGPTLLDRLSAQWSQYQTRMDATERLIDDKIAGLELQSTMIGPVHSAYISGRLVHVGDEIDGFTVVEIESRRVTLRFSGVTRSLIVR